MAKWRQPGPHVSPGSGSIAPMRSLLLLLVVAVVAGAGGCGGALQGIGEDRYTQGGGSMEPTVKAGQVITVRKVGSDYAPHRGDIVLFHSSGGRWGDSTAPFLKRIVAVGGETIACCDPSGRVTINGTALDEPYVTTNSPLDEPPNPVTCLPRRFGPVAVPTGSVFVMGDNRLSSNDSRCEGPIPATSVFAVMTG
jgi:signal peptidase I